MGPGYWPEGSEVGGGPGGGNDPGWEEGGGALGGKEPWAEGGGPDTKAG